MPVSSCNSTDRSSCGLGREPPPIDSFIYRRTDGHGYPVGGLRRSICWSAVNLGFGWAIKTAFSLWPSELLPLEGKPIVKWIEQENFGRYVAAYQNWKILCRIDYDPNFLSVEQLRDILVSAGQNEPLGFGHTGTFKVSFEKKLNSLGGMPDVPSFMSSTFCRLIGQNPLNICREKIKGGTT